MDIQLKICCKCNKEKPITNFRSRGGKFKHLLKNKCNTCLYVEHRQWCLSNPAKVKEYRVKDPWTIAKRCARRGITPEQLVTAFEKQKGLCLICCESVQLKDSAIDHNHNTGEFRGILCKTCNRALGLFRDSPAILRRATDYLETRGHYGDGSESSAEIIS